MPRDAIAARFAVSVTTEVHAKRPRTRSRSAHSLLSELMEQIGADACQRCEPEPCETGYAHDERSVKAQRFLLRHLDRVTRSARPPTAPGMSPGREQNGTETPNARATSRAVQSD